MNEWPAMPGAAKPAATPLLAAFARRSIHARRRRFPAFLAKNLPNRSMVLASARRVDGAPSSVCKTATRDQNRDAVRSRPLVDRVQRGRRPANAVNRAMSRPATCRPQGPARASSNSNSRSRRTKLSRPAIGQYSIWASSSAGCSSAHGGDHWFATIGWWWERNSRRPSAEMKRLCGSLSFEQSARADADPAARSVPKPTPPVQAIWRVACAASPLSAAPRGSLATRSQSRAHRRGPNAMSARFAIWPWESRRTVA